jgi:acyl-CoA synthetase (AMP-forming)/AMP-acid ligase II
MEGIWPVGLPRSLDYPAVPVGAVLAGSARRFGTRTAFRHGSDELSFAELWHRACRCANALAGQGIGRGSPVAVRMPNCLAYPVAYYGVLLAGATFVPISPLLPEAEAAHQIRDAGAAITLTAADIPALCANASGNPPYIGGPPTLFAGLLACPEVRTRDLSSVRAIGSGGAPLPMGMIEELRQLMPEAVLCEGYGLTEVTMGATNPPANTSGVRKPGSVGVAMFDTEIKIVPTDGGEDPLPVGAHGEVCLRGPQVMQGYHHQPEVTASTLANG